MMADDQEQWLIALEEENNERLAIHDKAMRENAKLEVIKAAQAKKKALAADRLKANYPLLSFLKRNSVIITVSIIFFITLGFNIFMFMH